MTTSYPLAARTLMCGRIISAYEGMRTYKVAIQSGGWVRGTYAGSGRGSWGANEQGSLAPGQLVWIGVDLTDTQQGNSYPILGACAQPNQDWAQGDLPTHSTGYPGQVGYEYDKRLTGKLRSEQLDRWATCQAEDADPRDTLPGDWTMVSSQGCGVGVETFRAWVRGGPMSGIWCSSEDQTTRLVGYHLQVHSLLTESEETHEGDARLGIQRGHTWAQEAIEDASPPVLEVNGPLYGGENRYQAGYSPVEATTAPSGLLHEHRGLDGAYMVRSAHSISLVRHTAIRVPTEVRPTGEVVPDLALPSTILDPQVTDPTVAQGLYQDPRPYLAPSGTVSGTPEPRPDALDRLSTMERLQNMIWRSRQGFEHSGRWSQRPPALMGELTLGNLGWANYLRGMYQSNIQVVPQGDLNLPDPTVALGTSGIHLGPDGSVTIQDAWGSQIQMTGGTITISPANDLVVLAGRTIQQVAGQDIILRAERHLEGAANSGDLQLKAENLLGLLGGNSGAGGLLLESRSTLKGVDESGDPLGLTLKSVGVLTLAAEEMKFEADTRKTEQLGDAPQGVNRGTIAFYAGKLLWGTETSRMVLGDDLVMRFTVDSTITTNRTVVMAAGQCVVPSLYSAGVCAQVAPTNEHVAAAESAGVAADNAVQTGRQGIQAADRDCWGFQWGDSADYGTVDATGFTWLEQPWQRLYRAPGAPASTVWRENLCVLRTNDGDFEATCPWPGLAAWTANPALTALPWTPWWDPVTDRYSDDLIAVSGQSDGTQYILPSTLATTVNTNLVIRPL